MSRIYLLFTTLLLLPLWGFGQCDASFTHFVAGDSVYFVHTNHNPGDSLVWDFGNGLTATSFADTTPYKYPISGYYNVELQVYNTVLGCSDTTKNHFIKYVDCEQVLSNITQQFSGNSMTVQYGGFFHMDVDSVEFDWGDGNFGSFTPWGLQQDSMHTYTADGTYYITITLQDTFYYSQTQFSTCSATRTDTFVATTPPATCDASFTAYPGADTISAFVDNLQPTDTYAWYLDGNLQVGQIWSDFYVNSLAPGTYTVSLVVQDSNFTCYDSTSQTVTIAPPPATCDASFTASVSGDSIFATATNPQPTDTYTWELDFFNAFQNSANFDTAGIAPGTYTLSLVVQDLAGTCYDSTTQTVTIAPPPPVCDASFTVNVFGDSISAIAANPQTGVLYDWLLNGALTLHPLGSAWDTTGLTPGTYTIQLVAISLITGCNDTVNQSFTIAPPPATCDASFTASVSGDSVFATPSNSQPTDTYTWFVDGWEHWEYTANFDSIGIAPGTYTLSLVVQDSNFTCYDSTAQTVTIAPQPALPNCGGTLVQQSLNGLSVTYTLNTQISLASQFSAGWNMGENPWMSTSTSSPTFSHTYTSPGTYTINVIINDINCADTVSTMVTVTQPSVGTNCQALLNYSVAPDGQTVIFMDGSFDNNGSQNYQATLDLGDGTSVQLSQPVVAHQYASAGTYTACIRITDTSGCTDSACVNVTISPQAPATWSISGQVTKQVGVNVQPVDFADVYLVEFDNSVVNTLTAIDTLSLTPADSGNYSFTGITGGPYYVKVALDVQDSDYNSFVPTYFGNTPQWLFAAPVPFTAGGQTANIQLIAGSNPGGPGFIGGSLSSGANKITYTDVNLSDRAVMLFDISNNSLVDFDYSDSNDEFAIGNLPYGTYRLHGEVLGLQTFDHLITLDPNQPSVNDVVIRVNEVATSRAPESVVYNSLLLYPNPTQDRTTLQVALERPTSIRVQAFDIQGRQVLTQSGDHAAGEAIIGLNTAELADGLYTLQVQIGAEVEHFKLVVQR